MANIIDGMPTGLYVAGYRQVWRVNHDGYASKVWERIVSRISDAILNCGIYLYASEDDALRGDAYGASGFLVGFPFDKCLPADHCYAVTCAHVIEKNNPVVRINTNHPHPDHKTAAIPLRVTDWIPHPNGD